MNDYEQCRMCGDWMYGWPGDCWTCAELRRLMHENAEQRAALAAFFAAACGWAGVR